MGLEIINEEDIDEFEQLQQDEQQQQQLNLRQQNFKVPQQVLIGKVEEQFGQQQHQQEQQVLILHGNFQQQVDDVEQPQPVNEEITPSEKKLLMNVVQRFRDDKKQLFCKGDFGDVKVTTAKKINFLKKVMKWYYNDILKKYIKNVSLCDRFFNYCKTKFELYDGISKRYESKRMDKIKNVPKN